MNELNQELLTNEEVVTEVAEEIISEGTKKSFSLAKGIGIATLLIGTGIIVYKKVIKPKRDAKKALNDFFDEIGLANTRLGEELGWNLDDGLIGVDFSTQLAEDGTPCLVVDYLVAPRYDYYKFM